MELYTICLGSNNAILGTKCAQLLHLNSQLEPSIVLLDLVASKLPILHQKLAFTALDLVY